MYNLLKKEDIIYLAGFIDGDGSILAQIVYRPDYKLKFQIRVSIILFQKTSRLWFLIQIHNLLQYGSLRNRPDSVSELTIVGNTAVKNLIILLLPYLRIKKPVAKLILLIIENSSKVKDRHDLLEVCKLVDQVANFTDSKKRIITTEYVIGYFQKNPDSF